MTCIGALPGTHARHASTTAVLLRFRSMVYALARDECLPLSMWAKHVSPRTRTPVAGVLYMLALTLVLATPMCFNNYIFLAVTSFAVVGCYVAYSLPILCK